MEKLFGIPLNDLMVVLLVIFGLGTIIIGTVALRNRAMLRMAVRNIPRRRAQTVLIVIGLMLATLLFSASFATGDTLTHSIRVEAVKWLGQVDVIVRGEARGTAGQQAYFDQSYFQQVRQELSDDPEIDGVAPLVLEHAPVVSPDSKLGEPQIDVLGYAEAWMGGFDRLMDMQGNILSVGDLAPGQVYLSKEAARKLDVGPWDTVQVFLGRQPAALRVARNLRKGCWPWSGAFTGNAPS